MVESGPRREPPARSGMILQKRNESRFEAYCEAVQVRGPSGLTKQGIDPNGKTLGTLTILNDASMTMTITVGRVNRSVKTLLIGVIVHVAGVFGNSFRGCLLFSCEV